jgi:hypothetical protein
MGRGQLSWLGGHNKVAKTGGLTSRLSYPGPAGCEFKIKRWQGLFLQCYPSWLQMLPLPCVLMSLIS